MSQQTIAAEFQIGDKVRVRRGVMDVNWPDLPLGGWAGTIDDVHDDEGMYTVRWSDETLEAMHPVFEKRCERDGLQQDVYWLVAEDLEPDTGGPLEIEQPTRIVTRPLSPDDQEDRIRTIFGLTSDDLLPDAVGEALETYCDYLSKNLTFPFTAKYGERDRRAEPIKVIGFACEDDERLIDADCGILCEARLDGEVVTLPLAELESVRGKDNRQLIADYRYWYWNYG